jgi:flavin reductase (DIM6/NTAB) family NADH-FMN oxidoreductase RutF
VPILNDCRRWFVGRILERRALGDHVGYLLEPIAAQHDATKRGLFFQEVKDLDPGHAP